MKNVFVILVFLILVFSANAQTEGLEVKVVDGKEYYQYPVEKGNTLYAISKKFGVSVGELVSVNPGAEKGLSIGQILNIPKLSGAQIEISDSDKSKLPVEDTAYIYHITQQGETLYSIAKFYGVKPKKLIEENKAYEHSLPLNSVVKVPKDLIKSQASDEVSPIEKLPEHPLASNKDSLVQHKVGKGETLYSISKQYNVSQERLIQFNPSLSEGLKKGAKIVIPLPRKLVLNSMDKFVGEIEANNLQINPVSGAVNVAVFAPFMFDEYKKEREKCLTEDCPVYRPTLLSLNYLHGVQSALDSLKKLGVSANVYVYDTKKDSSVVRNILSKKEFKDMQLILAPFFEHTVAPVVDYAKKHNVLVVNVVPQKPSLLVGNPNVSNVMASTETQVSALGKHVFKIHSKDNVIVLRDNNARHNYYRLFQDGFSQESDSATQSYMNKSLGALKGKLKRDVLNVFVVPSKDVRYVSDFLTKLNALANQQAYHTYKFKVYGLGDWLSFNNIDVNYLNRFNTCLAKASYIDYNNTGVVNYTKLFREEFNYDPNKFVFASFEATLYHVYMLAANKNFIQNYNSTTFSGSHINYDFKQSGGNGFENQSVVIIGFKNNQLQKID